MDAVRHALELGYRHIDTAFLYRNESLVGKVLGEFVGARKVQREQVFIVTKVSGRSYWNGYMSENI